MAKDKQIVSGADVGEVPAEVLAPGPELSDAELATEHKRCWDAGDFGGAAACMRKFRERHPGQVRQEGDGTVTLYGQPDDRLNFNTGAREKFDVAKGWQKVEAA